VMSLTHAFQRHERETMSMERRRPMVW
jgi:hypothetical protein